MFRFASFLLIVGLSALAFGQNSAIRSGSTVYIEPMNGYESYLSAAIMRKHVPLVVVTDKAKADYIITSSVSQHSPDSAAVVVNNNNTISRGGNEAFQGGWERGLASTARKGQTDASISVVDPKSSQVVYAYSVRKNDQSQFQSTAEACAKHLRNILK